MKKKSKLIKILFISFILFIIYLFMIKTGYYEYKIYSKVQLTNEAIVKFKKDISEGKNVKIEDYIENNYYDYRNPGTNLGSNIGYVIEKIMNEGIKKSLKILSELFYK